MSIAELHRLISQLESETPEQQNEASHAVTEMGLKGLTLEEGLLSLRSATRKFPPRDSELWDSASDLVIAAGRQARPEYVPLIEELFSEFTGKARTEAIRLLASIKERSGAVALMKIIAEHARLDGIQELPIDVLGSDPRHADVLFPKILDFADIPEFEWIIYLLCLKYLQAGVIEGFQLSSYSDHFLESYRKYKFELRSRQQTHGIAWMWEDNYRKCRETTCLLLDLFGYFPTAAIEKELREAITYHDSKVANFAAISLLRHGKQIDPRILREIARSAEVRTVLYEHLERLDRLSLFPDEFLTDEAFAESNLVQWLAFPTELDRAPDEIEFIKMVTVKCDSSVGLLDYYVFRFRTHEPHWSAKDGWLAGMSGPIPQEEADSDLYFRHTFSQFERWDNKTPEEHVDQMLGITSRHDK